MDDLIHEYKHKFSAWAASRAASVNGCRFSVEQGNSILEAAGLKKLLVSPEQLPRPQNVDAAHRKWREAIIDAAKRRGLVFTHGVAAKLINIYLKAALVCGGQHNNSCVQALHPPIDSQLLEKLYKDNIGGLRREWNKARKIRWSKFDSPQYEKVINSIRSALGENIPLWHIEEHWPGHIKTGQKN